MTNRARVFLFFSHLRFVHPFRNARVLPVVATSAACLCAISAFGQQRRQPQNQEPANSVRLRQEWFYRQRAYPHKHIPPGMRLKAFEQLRKMQAAQRATIRQLKQQAGATTPTVSATVTEAQAAAMLSSTTWTLIGPNPTTTPFAYKSVSGRVSALAVDPSNSDIVYLGGAQGGVWKTTDGGQTWTPLTDDQPSLAVGSIAIDPQNPQTIYVGTGEENFAGYNYAGAGVLKSTDGGSTWTQLAGPFVGPFAPLSPYCGGAYIGSIAVDPANSQIILAGTDFNCSLGSGVYRSTNGGTTWTEVLGSPQTPYVITGLVFDPTNGNNVYAAVGSPEGGSDNGIWKSTDGGLTWEMDDGSGTTVFPGSETGRISLAIAPSSPTTLYAGAASASSGNVSVLGVYKTTDGGATWTQLTSAPPYCSPPGGSQQCYYDNVVAVSPADANIVLLGGSAPGPLHLSLDGGSTWTDISTDSSGNSIHVDMHAIAFSSDGSKMYVGNDGGAWSTSLNSTGIGSWTDLNQQLALTQFYPGMSLNPANSNSAFAGSQDNGTQEYAGQLAWQWIACGDGGQTAFNYITLSTLYVSCQYDPPNLGSFLFKLTSNPSVTVAADSGIDGNDRGAFIPPLAMDPSNPNTLYFGTYRIYQTTDGATSWAPISGDLTSGNNGSLSTISAIAVAPSDSNTVYVGTGDGMLSVTTNANSGATWISITNGTPDRSVTAIAVNPTDARTAYATFSGYSGFNGDTLGHVLETTDGGTTWTDISGNLPNVPVNDIVLDPDIPNTFYIGTDIGVFYTSDGGTAWEPLGTGLPDVAIMSLKVQHATRILSAASYGRSAWDIQLPAATGPTAVLSTPALDFPSQQVGITSSALDVTLTNNSSTALAISGMTASDGFAETDTCGTSLAPNGNCTISVTFTPGALGPQTGTVIISDNAVSGSTQTISLSGEGVSGPVNLSPASLSFGNQLVGLSSNPQSVTLTNTSVPLTITKIAEPSDFQVLDSNCPLSTSGTLADGASCSISIGFFPTTMGTFAEQVTITDSASNSPQAITLTGTGVEAVVTVSPTSLNFNQAVGTTSTQAFTITNSGNMNLAISSINVTSNSGVNAPTLPTESDNCPRSPATISPQAGCTANVTFAPNTWGTSTGSIEISSNGAPSSVAFSTAAYSGAAKFSPTSVTFPDEQPGQTSPPQTVTLKNSATTPLIITSINFGGPFTKTSDDCPRSPSVLNAGGSCTISADFSPGSQLSSGVKTGSIGITGSAQTSNQVALQGTVIVATASLSNSQLEFGKQGLGTTSTEQSVTVANTGTADLTISNLSTGGADASDFAIVTSGTTCSTGTPIAAGSSCTISVMFTPTAPGARNGTLNIADNAPNSPQTVQLSGTGDDFTMTTESGTSATATVSPGSSANYSLTMTPEGGFNQTVSLICSGAPSLATCTVTPPSVALDGTNAQNVKVMVTTTAPGFVAPGTKDGPPGPGGFAVSDWWITVLVLIGILALALERRRRLALLTGALLLAAMAAGCGGGTGGGGGTSPPPGTPAGNYTLTVTGTSGSLTHNTTLKMTVQ